MTVTRSAAALFIVVKPIQIPLRSFYVHGEKCLLV